ncbi:MAG: restriction endonuclease subunit S [Nitrosomonas sp.]|uniref:restriction endonuclease subunit S n=1 Tax=Nitrosomonas sp. TaxID=42353 RepID=UPI0032EAF241
MELKPGYKRTEAGIIPEQWNCMKLGNFIALQRGHDLTWRDRRQGDVPIMGSAGHNGFHDTAIVKGPGVVLGRSGASFGQAHYCAQDFWPHNTALYVTNFLGNFPLFVFYFLESIDFSRHNSGGAQQSLNRNFISPIAVGVPHPLEQTVIANALSDTDALIQSLTSLIAKKRQIKQGAMQTLLNPYENGRLKEGWVVKKLSVMADIDPENLNASVNPNYKFKYISLDDVDKGVLRNYSDQIFETAPSRARRIVKKGDILFGTVRPNLQSHCLIKNHVEDLVCSTGFAVIRCRNNIANPPYIFSLFFAEFVEKQIQTLLAGSNYPAINSSDVRKLDIPLPQMDEQIHIAKILSNMDTEIAALEAKLAKYRHIKQGMMQNLLTGRIRLVKPDSNTGAFA